MNENVEEEWNEKEYEDDEYVIEDDLLLEDDDQVIYDEEKAEFDEVFETVRAKITDLTKHDEAKHDEELEGKLLDLLKSGNHCKEDG